MKQCYPPSLICPKESRLGGLKGGEDLWICGFCWHRQGGKGGLLRISSQTRTPGCSNRSSKSQVEDKQQEAGPPHRRERALRGHIQCPCVHGEGLLNSPFRRRSTGGCTEPTPRQSRWCWTALGPIGAHSRRCDLGTALTRRSYSRRNDRSPWTKRPLQSSETSVCHLGHGQL